MQKIDYPPEVRALVSQLKRLPGIGARSAERMAVWVLQDRGGFAEDCSRILGEAAEKISACPTCGFYQSQGNACAVCDAKGRETATICVVEQPTDVLPLERSGAYSGLYHVLGGRLAPLDNIGPDDLRIAELDARIKSGASGETAITEVILALSADVEGEATANYLAELLAPRGIAITRLAQGLPAGGGLEHADALTLARALGGRRAL